MFSFFHGFGQDGELRSFSADSTRAANSEAFQRIRPWRRTPKLLHGYDHSGELRSFSTDSTRAANSEAFPRTRPGRRDPKLYYGFDQGGELQTFPRIRPWRRTPKLSHGFDQGGELRSFSTDSTRKANSVAFYEGERRTMTWPGRSLHRRALHCRASHRRAGHLPPLGPPCVAGALHRRALLPTFKTCNAHSLQHQPDDKISWYDPGFLGGGVVAGTAYSKSML
jgi:hypothetical protein